MHDYQREFLDLALSREALRFGRFTLKSGRESPYFFNAGLFNDGEALAVLGHCYAAAIARSALGFDMLFGPAYKGIPLAAATAIALAREHGRSIIGHKLEGRVLIIDDVITAGTAIRESVSLIRDTGARPVGIALALDRQERGTGERSAVQEVEADFGLACLSILTLEELIEALGEAEGDARRIPGEYRVALETYRQRYGVA
jgi:orotate phosphoribosyltransferase